MKNQLTEKDLKVGKTYRGKRFREILGWNNDRMILWIGDGKVQYDSYTVRDSRRYPTVTIQQFLNWAKEEVVPNSPQH